jgi:hypothetical protein
VLPKLTSAKLALHKLGVETHVFAGCVASLTRLRKFKRCTSAHLTAAPERLLAAARLIRPPRSSRRDLMKMGVISAELYGIGISFFDRPDQSVPGDHRSGLDIRSGHRTSCVA